MENRTVTPFGIFSAIPPTSRMIVYSWAFQLFICLPTAHGPPNILSKAVNAHTGFREAGKPYEKPVKAIHQI